MDTLANAQVPNSFYQDRYNAVDPERAKQLASDHQVWLHNPTTQLFLRAIDNLEKRTISMLVSDLNPKEPNIAHQHGTMIKSIREVKKIAEDSETFIARSTQR